MWAISQALAYLTECYFAEKAVGAAEKSTAARPSPSYGLAAESVRTSPAAAPAALNAPTPLVDTERLNGAPSKRRRRPSKRQGQQLGGGSGRWTLRSNLDGATSSAAQSETCGPSTDA